MTLSGNNTYNGTTTIKTGNVVRITSGTAFGSTNGATTVEDGGWVEMSGGINVTESFALYGDASTGYGGVLRSNGGSNVLSGLVLNGSRIICNSGSLDIVGGATGGQLVLGANGSAYIKVLGKPINIWNNMEVSGNYVRTDVENALATSGTLTLGGANPSGVNMNGNNQTVGQLISVYTNPATRIVYSTTPATLTVNQSATSTFNASITGAVNVVKIGTGALTLSGTNTTYGTVSVTNGTLLVNSTGTLGVNCTNVVVAGLGTLTLSNSVSIANNATLSIANGGTAKVNLAAGVNEAVGTLYFGSMQKRAGTYGATGSGAQVIDTEHFAGTGILTVLHDKSGTLLRVQ